MTYDCFEGILFCNDKDNFLTEKQKLRMNLSFKAKISSLTGLFIKEYFIKK